MSVDFDIKRFLSIEESARLILLLAMDGDIFDFWLQAYEIDERNLGAFRRRQLEIFEPLAEAAGLKI